MIAYVKSWQHALNDTLRTQGLVAFQFNTYIISVLVIFFLQMNYDFPKVDAVPLVNVMTINTVPSINKDALKKAIRAFFNFYAKQYEVDRLLISVQIGRWQERRLQAEQRKFTAEQKRFV